LSYLARALLSRTAHTDPVSRHAGFFIRAASAEPASTFVILSLLAKDLGWVPYQDARAQTKKLALRREGVRVMAFLHHRIKTAAYSAIRRGRWTVTADPSAKNAEIGFSRSAGSKTAPYKLTTSMKDSVASTLHTRHAGWLTWYSTVPPSRWRV
jgi:hypothetical protein